MNLKAFVVEDNLAIRESLIETLAELADIATAGVAGTEQAAIAWLTDPASAWDIAIVDLGLGRGSGFGVLRALRERKPHQKMVVLTGTATQQARKESIALGADGVFDKSLETDAMLSYCIALSRENSDATPFPDRQAV